MRLEWIRPWAWEDCRCLPGIGKGLAEVAMLHKTAATYTYETSSPLPGLPTGIQLLMDCQPAADMNEILTEIEGAGKQIMAVIHMLRKITELQYKPYIGGRVILDLGEVE